MPWWSLVASLARVRCSVSPLFVPLWPVPLRRVQRPGDDVDTEHPADTDTIDTTTT
ncbi:hypothetical protein AB0G00_16545 [Nocardia salmonicida]|uniref:hypothetical protein n=1 Tax=Nocardia salmonicida TaxID=53431 RepID=UPI0033EE1599